MDKFNQSSYLVWSILGNAWLKETNKLTDSLVNAKRFLKEEVEEIIQALNKIHINVYAVPVIAFINTFTTTQPELNSNQNSPEQNV